MPIKKVEKNMAIISALSDLPNATDGLSAATFKEKFDEGGIALKNYINDVLIPALQSSAINNSGADQIGATTIADLNGATVQTLLQSIRDRLKATTNNASGADFVSATAIEGLSGNSVQALIRSLKSYVDTRESTGNHAGTWQGVTRTDMVNDYIGRDATLNTRINGIVAQSGNDNTEIVDARGGAPVLRDRLDGLDTQIAQIAINPKVLGAIGDGVADDTMYIQEAINKGSNILLVDTFKITSPITVPSGKKILSRKGKLLANSSHFTALNIIGSDVIIDGLEIEGVGSNIYNSLGSLIVCSGVDNGVNTPPTYIKNITLENCKFTNGGRSAVKAQFVDSLKVKDCDIRHMGYAGVEVLSCKNVDVDDNQIHHIKPGAPVGQGINAYGVYFSQVNTVDTLRHPFSENCRAKSNIISDIPWEGVDTHGGIDIRFIDNKITNTVVGVAIIKADGENGETVGGVKNVFANDNIISDCVFGVSVSDVGSGKTHDNVIVDNNIITNCGNISSGGGISARDVKNLIVADNLLDKCKYTGVQLRGNVFGCSIKGNTFKDIHTESTSSSVFAYGVFVRDDHITGVISGNTLVNSGDISTTKLNDYGIAFDGNVINIGLDIQGNNFEVAKISKHLLSTNQALNIQPPIVQRGRATLTPSTSANSVTTTVTLNKVYSANTLYEIMATLVATGSHLVTLEVNRTNTSTITIIAKTVNGANFTSTGNITVAWLASGF